MPNQQSSNPFAEFKVHRRMHNGWTPAILLLGSLVVVKAVGNNAKDFEHQLGVQTNLKGHHSPEITIVLPDLARELATKSTFEITEFVRPVLSDMIVRAWATFQQDARAGVKHTSPVVQFMRHIRNGCGHGNRISIRDKDPIRLAEWRGIRLTKADEGTQVLYRLMNVADVFHLVNDVCWELFPE